MPADITLEDLYGAFDEDAIAAAVARTPPPRTPDLLFDKLRALRLGAGDLVIDVGCGPGRHTRQIADTAGCRVLALDYTAVHTEALRDALRQSPDPHIGIARAAAEAVPVRAGTVSAIWCRDMLYHVDLPRTFASCASALRAGGHMLIYMTFPGDLLEPREADRLFAGTAGRRQNLDPAYFTACAAAAGFAVVERDVVGSEWRETDEAPGASQPTTAKLLRAARLLRHEPRLRAELGEKLYEMALADTLWGIYQMIGKLRPTIYVLRRG